MTKPSSSLRSRPKHSVAIDKPQKLNFTSFFSTSNVTFNWVFYRQELTTFFKKQKANAKICVVWASRERAWAIWVELNHMLTDCQNPRLETLLRELRC